MLTDADYHKWLLSPTAKRVLLVELEHSQGWEYVANLPYISTPNCSQPNRPYRDLLTNVANIAQRIDAQLSLGDITLVNDASIDTWASKAWRGYQVIFKLGDASWPLDDFRILAKQVNAGVLQATHTQLRLGIYDTTALLDKPLARRPVKAPAETETEAETDTENPAASQVSHASQEVAPLIFGQVLGTKAYRVNTTDLTYCASHLPIISLTVRDGNGAELSLASQNLAQGQFELNAYTPRDLWCEINCGYSTATEILNWVANYYGLPVKAELELPNYTLGFYYPDEVTGRQILDDLCQALGGFWLINLLGELEVIILTAAPEVADLELTADDLELGKLSLIRVEDPLAQLTLSYAQNHQPLTEVAGNVADNQPELAERLRTPWHSQTGNNPVNHYPLAEELEIETTLQQMEDAQTEVNRRLNLRSTRREVWELGVFMQPNTQLIGKALHLNHPKLAGKIGRVISQSLAPTQNSATLEVWY